MFKIAIVVVLVSVVTCRRNFDSRSPDSSAFKSLLLAQSALRPQQPHAKLRKMADRLSASRMQEVVEKTATEKKAEFEAAASSGPLEMLVLTVRDVVGEQQFQKIRAKVIKDHSKVISDFVETSDGEFGQAALKTMFEVADKDKSGTLDREELREGMKALGFVATSDKDLDRIFKKVDKDNNEVIDFEEFVEGAPAVLRKQLTELAKSNGKDLGFLVPPSKPSPEISDDFQDSLSEFGYAFGRIIVGLLIIHHGQEVLLSSTDFVKYTLDKRFPFLPGPHLYWAYIIGAIEWICPVFVALGVFSRAAALTLVPVMAGAFYHGVKESKGFEGFPYFELQGLGAKLKMLVPAFHNYGFETPLLYISALLLIATVGPGKNSISQLLGWNDDNTILGKLKQ